jgi:hypothetical protein
MAKNELKGSISTGNPALPPPKERNLSVHHESMLRVFIIFRAPLFLGRTKLEPKQQTCEFATAPRSGLLGALLTNALRRRNLELGAFRSRCGSKSMFYLFSPPSNFYRTSFLPPSRFGSFSSPLLRANRAEPLYVLLHGCVTTRWIYRDRRGLPPQPSSFGPFPGERSRGRGPLS